jgi:hypothetical protein
MSANLAIKVDAFWEEEPGDGGKCFNCDDARWLLQYRLMLRVANEITPQDNAICQSCHGHEQC